MADVIDCDYTVEGAGTPLFLIHGIGAARDVWRFLTPALTKNFTVIRYDLRGHGTSPVPDGDFDLDDLVNDLERVRERTGFEQAHFAGHSLGGMIAPAYARKHPDRVKSLAVLSTAAGRTEDDSAKVWAVVQAMEQNGVEQTLDTLIERWYTDAFIKAHPDIVRRRLEQVVNTNTDIFMKVFRIYAGTEMLPWLHEIKAPSLVLTGELDGGCNPRLNKLIADAIPNSELVILPGLKHALLLEAGELVAQQMIRFITSTGVGPSG